MAIIYVRPAQNTADAFLRMLLSSRPMQGVVVLPSMGSCLRSRAYRQNVPVFWRRESITIEPSNIVPKSKIDFRSVAPGMSAFSVLSSSHPDIDPVVSEWEAYRPDRSLLPLLRQFVPQYIPPDFILGLFLSPLGILKISVSQVSQKRSFYRSAAEMFGVFFSINEVRIKV